MPLSFSTNLNPGALAQQYSLEQRLHIPGIFPQAIADALLQCLIQQVPWEMVYENKKTKKAELVSEENYAALSHQEKQQLQQSLGQEARDDFQYLYHSYPMLDKYLQDKNQMPELLMNFLDWVNTPDTLDFFRQVTSKNNIIKADAQATRYGPLQFLNKHNDVPRGEHRVIAYVVNITPNWNPNWGGFLQFYDAENNIEAAYLPTFNAINLFSVPMEHAVSQITSFAGGYRYAITGWFRSA